MEAFLVVEGRHRPLEERQEAAAVLAKLEGGLEGRTHGDHAGMKKPQKGATVSLLKPNDLASMLGDPETHLAGERTLTDVVMDDALSTWTGKGILRSYLKKYVAKLSKAINELTPSRIQELSAVDCTGAMDAIRFECDTFAEATKVCDEEWWLDFYDNWKAERPASTV